MGLLTLIGVGIIAERIGNKVQDMAEDSHRKDLEKTRLNTETNRSIAKMQEDTKRQNAALRAEIAKMHEETARANARISAEARIQAEKIRAASQVATAAILTAGERHVNRIYSSNEAVRARSIGDPVMDLDSPTIPTAIPETRFCPFCGNGVAPESFFCRSCGKRIR